MGLAASVRMAAMTERAQYEHCTTAVDKLIPYATNSRTHSDEQISQIAASIREWGFTNPVLIDEENTIIAGHGRVLAAKKLELKEAPCIVLAGLTEWQKKAYVIADNKLAMNAGWDYELLSAEVKGLDELDFDVGLIGFSADELDDLLAGPATEGLTDEDAIPEPPEEPVTVLGDIWTLGNHRLMCGDSTNAEVVARLMDGKKADMVFTDPPYGVNYTSACETMYYSGKKGKPRAAILGDENCNIYGEVFPVLNAVCSGVMYVFCGAGKEQAVLQAIDDNNIDLINTLIWDKLRFGGHVMGANYKPCFEMFYYLIGKNKNRMWCGANNEQTIWKLKRDHKTDMHPTQKPVELAETAIMNHSVGLVLDVFGGSGSTLIACEKTNRTCYMMELDPTYCDVIINRWQDYTGKEAVNQDGETFKSNMELKNAG